MIAENIILLPLSLWCFIDIFQCFTAGLFEAAPPGFQVGIALRGVSKTYSGGKKALKNLNINIYKGQVTSLLGHNGAAKTTTL